MFGSVGVYVLVPSAAILGEFGEEASRHGCSLHRLQSQVPIHLQTLFRSSVPALLCGRENAECVVQRGKEGEGVGLTVAASAKLLFPKDILSVVGVLLN